LVRSYRVLSLNNKTFPGALDHTKRFSTLAKQTMFVSSCSCPDSALTRTQGGVIDSNEEEIVKKLDFSIKLLAGKQLIGCRGFWIDSLVCSATA
jgi:hypothetical protein